MLEIFVALGTEANWENAPGATSGVFAKSAGMLERKGDSLSLFCRRAQKSEAIVGSELDCRRVRRTARRRGIKWGDYGEPPAKTK